MSEQAGGIHEPRGQTRVARREDGGHRQATGQREPELNKLVAAAQVPGVLAQSLAANGSTGRAEAVLGLQRRAGNLNVQRALAPAAAAAENEAGDLATRIMEASSRGEGPDSGARAELEADLGVDLSGVRVHYDAEADSLARAVDAAAFTSGQDIFFAAGTYDPHSPQGRRLLAHEVAHTVQQAAGPVPGTPAPGGISLSDPEDSFERAASGYAAGNGGPLPAAGDGPATNAAVQRDGDYPWSGPVMDAASSLLWDVGGSVPGAGTIVNGAALGIDAGKWAIDSMLGDEKSASKRVSEMQLDAYGMVPLVGTGLGYSQISTDFSALLGRASGQTAEQAPLFSDMWHEERMRPETRPLPPQLGGEGAGSMPEPEENQGYGGQSSY